MFWARHYGRSKKHRGSWQEAVTWTLVGKGLSFTDEPREGFRCQGPSEKEDEDGLP